VKNIKLPRSLPAAADRLFTVKKERLAQQKIVDRLREEQTAIEDFIINNLPKSEASGVAGRVARAQLGKKIIPTIENWEKLCAFVKKHNAFELFQRRLNEGAATERTEAGKPVPGIGSFTRVTVSCTKI
jgi:hypothetical protein